MAQFSPVYGTVIRDFNGDNRVDILLVGNSYAEETITGYYDASYGNLLINKGSFEWEMPLPVESNLLADGDTKALAQLVVGDKPVYFITENDGPVKSYLCNSPRKEYVLDLEEDDWYYYLEHNNLSRKIELYHGAGYLSLSSRKVMVPLEVRSLGIHKYRSKN
jgi:hypothetical protein